MRKKRIDSETLATTLVDEFIDHRKFDVDFSIEIPVNVQSDFQQKTRLYRLALVLSALMVEEEQNERFGMVREILEGKLLPASPDLTILNEIRTAGGHLAELLSPTGNPREMSWAMKWLDDVGIDESNPVTLALFSMKWIDSYVAIVKFLRIYKPI